MRQTVPIVVALVIVAPGRAADVKRAGPDWWALQPVASPAIPKGGEGSAIDAFVHARLRAIGLQPAAEADRLTLLRRVTFDLTGLPPTLAEVDAFLQDRDPKAYERVVDRLLASPAYGERWARHWLDVVRYSESHGFEYDRLRDNAWPYRDYVIRALNVDKPYADFVREQIAGDVLTPATPDGIVATGVLVAGPYDQAGNGAVSASIRGKAREDELEDLVGLVGQSFLGVTMNCARCHDHKVDPYSAADYYRLKAVFEGVFHGERQAVAPEELKRRQAEIDRREGRIRDLLTELAQLDQRIRRRAIAKRGPRKGEAVFSTVAPIHRWTFDEDGRDSSGGLHAAMKNGARVERGRLVVDGERSFAQTPTIGRELTAKTLEAWVTLPTLKQGGGGVISIQVSNGGLFDAIVFGERVPNKWMAGSEGFVRTRDLTGPDEMARPDELIHVAVTYAHDGRITLYRNGRAYGAAYTPPVGRATFKAREAEVVFGLRHTGGGRPYLKGEIEEARIYDRELTSDEVLNSFRRGVEGISAEEIKAVTTADEAKTQARTAEEIARLQREAATFRHATTVYAPVPRQPGPTRVLRRGDIDKPGDPVTAGSPTVVKGPPPINLPAGAAEGERRRQLAEWIVHRDNPLTWRVIVNRVWQHHFGEGLVRTPNDFGLNGERPTHPELLDYLAATFRDGGGRLKPLHREIVTSAAYRQSAAPNPKAAAVDADNRLLWRYTPRRLEAEAVRDAMLAVSGKLNPEAGGPSFRPFKIETFNSAFYVNYDEDRADLNRRSVYRMNVTSARDPVLEVLDCPDPSVKTPRRSSTTTPLQALTMMNNPFTDRLAKAMAERLAREAGPDVGAQVERGYRLAYGRPATEAERTRAVEAVGRAGLKAVCWALLNSSEFAYIR